MERLMHREDAFVVYDSPKTPPNRRSLDDLDFDDVFGGPPRRFSMQEVKARFSFGESEEDVGGGASSSKPVFGEESLVVQRKRHQSDDFFNDIFKGGESPRRGDRDRDAPFGSNPSSRIMSPARPLPPRTDPSASSLPALFSLPAKLTKGTELPTFASHNQGQLKMEGPTTGLNSPHSSTTLSRFSNPVIRGQDEIRNRQNHLSHEASFSSDEDDSPSSLTSDKKDNSAKKGEGVGNQFHFSIYKWAGRGVPMLMTLVAGNNLRSKDNIKYDISASERVESESSTVRKQALSAKDVDPLKMEHKKELQDSVEAIYAIPESDVSVVLDGIGQNIEEQVKSLEESDILDKFEAKRVHVSVSNEVEKPGKTKKTKETKSGTPKEFHANALDSKKLKKKEGTGIDLRNATADKPSLQSASINVTRQKSVGKGKVREFVQIFNQETDSTPAADVEKRSQSYRRKNGGVDQKESKVSSDAAKAKEKDDLHNVDESMNNNERQKSSPVKTPRYTTSPKKVFSSETLHTDSNISVENLDDTLEDNFLVQELPNDHEKVKENESSEDTKTIDAKIRQWSVGKKGNIRSLLSTLQNVLWPESGWKVVPLVDLIEANSVKRAYQKALLRLHPDKLQQKGAAFHEKYTAEKVFDILQEAWDHFNTSSSLNL